MTKATGRLLSLTTLLLGLGLSGPAWPGEGLKVQVVIDPSEQLLEPGKQLPVTIRVTEGEGSGVEGLQVRLDVSRGTVGPVAEQGGGLYRASYQMPSERHPQAVVLAAKVSGAAPAWAVLKLSSQVELPTQTSKPRVQVRLSLGGRSYGPARSDAQGKVKVPVEVRPGETEATAIAVDEFGNRTERSVKIPIPPTPHLVGFAERNQLSADGRDSTEIYLVSIQPDGSPSENLRVVAVRKAGKLSPARKLAPGLYQLAYTAPERLDRERVALVLADKSDPNLSRREFVFGLRAGKPASLTLEADPRSLPADGRSTGRLTVTIGDQAKNPLEGLAPTLQCERGSVKPVRELGAGKYQAVFQAPAGGPGPLACQAELGRPQAGPLVARTELSLTPPAVGGLEASVSQSRLPMDGRSSTRIEIALTDSAGNPLDGVQVQVQAGIGSVDPVSADGNGRYHASYTAPRGEQSTRVRIEVIAGLGNATRSRQLLVDLEGIEPPRPPAAWVTLGPSAALLTNFGRLLSGGFSVDAAVRVPGLSGYLYLSLEAGYRFGRSTDATGFAGQQVRTDLEVAPLHLTLVFKPLPLSVATPFVGIGGGLDFVQWAVRGPQGIIERDHAMLWGALALIGGEVRVGPGAVVLSMRYLYAFLSDRAGVEQAGGDAGSRIKGSVGGLDVCLGYQLHF